MGACSLPAESNPPVHTNHPHFPISCNGTPISCNETCTSCAEICQSATSIATGCFGLQARFVCFGLCHICPRIAVKRKIDLYRTGDQTPLHPGRNFLETRVGMNCIEPHDHHLFFCKLFLKSSQLPTGVSPSEHPPWVVEFERGACAQKAFLLQQIGVLFFQWSVSHMADMLEHRERRLVVDSTSKKFAEKQMNGREVRYSSCRLVKLCGND